MALLQLVAAFALANGPVPPFAWSDAKVGAIAAFAAYPSMDVADVVTLTMARDAHGAQLVVAREVFGGYDSGVEVTSRECLPILDTACPPASLRDETWPARFSVPLEIRWASSADCPAIIDILAQIRAFPAPPPIPPGWSYPRGIDGTDYHLWSTSNSAGAGPVDVSGWSDAPVAGFIDNSLGRLRSCWRSEKPKILSR